jgi:importin-7
MTHFIQRYGNPRYCSEEDKPFADYFRGNTAIQLLAPAMNNLQIKARGGFLTDDVHRSCLTYLSNCAEMSPTYKVIKPHLNFVLFEVVFPTLCLTHEDARLFDDDPVEFIRKVGPHLAILWRCNGLTC